jgi:hypothetical protein
MSVAQSHIVAMRGAQGEVRNLETRKAFSFQPMPSRPSSSTSSSAPVFNGHG